MSSHTDHTTEGASPSSVADSNDAHSLGLMSILKNVFGYSTKAPSAHDVSSEVSTLGQSANICCDAADFPWKKCPYSKDKIMGMQTAIARNWYIAYADMIKFDEKAIEQYLRFEGDWDPSESDVTNVMGIIKANAEAIGMVEVEAVRDIYLNAVFMNSKGKNYFPDYYMTT